MNDTIGIIGIFGQYSIASLVCGSGILVVRRVDCMDDAKGWAL